MIRDVVKTGAARAVSYAALAVFLCGIAVYLSAHLFFTGWFIVGWLIATTLIYAGTYTLVMAGTSLSSLGWIWHWISSLGGTSSATFRSALFWLVLSAVFGFAVPVAMFAGGETPVFTALSFAVFTTMSSLSAAKSARRDYYLLAVDPDVLEWYHHDDDNWGQRAAKVFTRSIAPRATGDYSKFACYPLLVIMHVLIISAITLAFGVLPVYTVTAGVNDLYWGLALIGITPLIFWFTAAAAGRLISEIRRFNPSSVDLAPTNTECNEVGV